MAPAQPAASPRVGVVADDLIWASRLAAAVERAGGGAVTVSRQDGLAAAGVEAVLVDLGARRVDPLAILRAAADAGLPTLAVMQHDDAARRKQARAAGATRVTSYNAFHQAGPRLVARLLARPAADPRRDANHRGGANPGRGANLLRRTTGSGASDPGTAPQPAGIPPVRYGERLEAARTALHDRGAAALLLGPGAELRWLAGYAPLPLERLTLLVVPADGPATLLVPRLEALGGGGSPAVQGGLVALATWEETDDPYARAAQLLPVSASRLGARFLVSQPLWALHLLRLQAALPGARWELAATVLRGLRIVKDAQEIELLRAAAHAADEVVLAIVRGRLIGRTEADVGREVRERLVAAGHDEASFWIVGSGPYSAEPHHEAGERLIVAGEPVVLDIGGVRAGYCSDTTRTVWPTGGDPGRGPDDTFRRLYGALEEAQAAAVAAVRPGVAAEAIDAVARRAIGAAGFREAFTHRTGHGIGLEAHEDPYLVAGNRERLAVGHAFSVEPGIYLEGRYGARIEDIVACGADGPDVLNRTERDLFVVNGA